MSNYLRVLVWVGAIALSWLLVWLLFFAVVFFFGSLLQGEWLDVSVPIFKLMTVGLGCAGIADGVVRVLFKHG